MNIKAFVVAQHIPEALNIFGFQLFFSLLFRLGNFFWSIFKFTDSFLCNQSSAIEPIPKYFTLVIVFLCLKIFIWFFFISFISLLGMSVFPFFTRLFALLAAWI